MRKTMPQIHDYSSFVGCEAEHDVAGRRTMEVTGKTVRFSAMRFPDETDEIRYVHMLLNQATKELVVVSAERDERDAIRWKDESGEMIAISAAVFCQRLYDMMGWNKQYKYRVNGDLVTVEGAKAIRFDLGVSEAFPINAEPTICAEFVTEPEGCAQ